MDPELQQQENAKREAARKRTLTYCRNCGGTLDHEMPHPLGLPLLVLQCNKCGREETLVKKGNYYKRPGGRI